MEIPDLCNWIPISEMKKHVHGLYLCLIHDEGEGKNCDDFSIEERYFTYNKAHESTFQSTKEATGVIAFMTPRYYGYSTGREKELQKENRRLRIERDKVTPEQHVMDSMRKDVSNSSGLNTGSGMTPKTKIPKLTGACSGTNKKGEECNNDCYDGEEYCGFCLEEKFRGGEVR